MEVIVKVNDGPEPSSYKDGDIVQAFSMYDIYYCHAQHKCHVNNFGLDDVTGNRSPEELLIKFLEKTKTYKFERLNSNEVKKTNLITHEVSILNKTPNADGERIDVHAYLVRRLKKESHLIFGKSGREYWYGKERSNIDVNAVWNDIETHTDFLQSDHIHYPLSDLERRLFFTANCCMHGHEHDHNDLPGHAACLDNTCGCNLSECTNDFISERISSVVQVHNEGTEDEYNEILHRRKFQVPYWDLATTLSYNVDNIRNSSVYTDERKQLNDRPAADLLTLDKVAAGIIT